jgi:hypothetical protein
MKDILIVAEDPVGIMQLMLQGISEYSGYTYDYIDHYVFKRGFRYKNFGHRAYNFYLKSFHNRNLKQEHFHRAIDLEIRSLQAKYKKILIIRPDLLHDQHLQLLRQRTNCLIAYYWDSVAFFPRKLQIIRYFDQVFSFDPADCAQYGFTFQSNFYSFEVTAGKREYGVYNLSSTDHRRSTIEQVAAQLEGLEISYLFKGFSDKPFRSKYIQQSGRMPYKTVIRETSKADVVLDVTKQGQKGLTFRPFEALGLQKKLITTNAGIMDYDFYHPNNILVIDSQKPKLDIRFFECPFQPVAQDIKERHHLRHWLKAVLGEPSLSLSEPTTIGNR